MVQVKITNKSNNQLPEYATQQSAGVDVCAYIPKPIIISPNERVLIKTGLFLELPVGVECQVRPRSGLALKHGVTVLNSPGTIDSDYRGEVGVILINLGGEDFIVNSGDRIAQLVFARHETVIYKVTEQLSETVRGEGGFGHTGK